MDLGYIPFQTDQTNNMSLYYGKCRSPSWPLLLGGNLPKESSAGKVSDMIQKTLGGLGSKAHPEAGTVGGGLSSTRDGSAVTPSNNINQGKKNTNITCIGILTLSFRPWVVGWFCEVFVAGRCKMPFRSESRSGVLLQALLFATPWLSANLKFNRAEFAFPTFLFHPNLGFPCHVGFTLQ